MKIKEIDPVLAAELSVYDFDIVCKSVELLNTGTKEPDFPPELYAPAFYIFRKIGASNVRSYHGMRIAAFVFANRRLAIDRLRAWTGVS